VSEIGPELQGMVQAPVEFAKKTTDPNLSVPQRLAAAAGLVASATQLDPMLPRAATKLPAGEGFVWGAKPIDQIQGLPKSGVMPESRFAKAGSEAGQFSNDELALMKQVVPDAFTQSGVDVPKLHEGLAESGPVVEVKKLGEGQEVPTQTAQRLAEVTHELDTRFPQWRNPQQGTPEIIPELRQLIGDRVSLEDMVRAEGKSTRNAAQYAFVGPKPEAQMPGYVEGLVRLPQKQIPLSESDLALRGGINPVEPPLYQGPHFGAEDSNVLSSYRGFEDTLPNGEKTFHVIEVQSDWGQRQRHVDEQLSQGLRHPEEKVPGHPLLQHYETLGLKAAIQHAKEIGATKVILPDAETAMMTEGHDNKANIRYEHVPGAQPTKVTEPYTYGFATRVPEGWTAKDNLAQYVAADPSGKLFKLHAVNAYSTHVPGDIIANKAPGSGILQAEVWAVPVEPKIPQEGGMRLHYDQTLPSAMRKLTGDKGTPVDLGAHKSANLSQAQQDMLARGEGITGGSPVFKDAAGKPKTNITGKIYDISKTPDQFKLMKAGDKFSAAKYLAS
jgi:hypothetical protein